MIVVMKKKGIFTNDWLSIHPYRAVQSTDQEYVRVANRLYEAYVLKGLPEVYGKRMALYVAAYMEDIKSNLGLWNGFTSGSLLLHGKLLPFYDLGEGYDTYAINREDVRFIVWNTWQKAHYKHGYIDPMSEEVKAQAEAFYGILMEEFERVEPNEVLDSYFESTEGAEGKLKWLFAHTYLTEPYMHVYIDSIQPGDIYMIPTGPLALFLYEWVDLIAMTDEWTKVKGLVVQEPELTAEMKRRNGEIYRNFTKANGGRNIVYLNGYDNFKQFLLTALGWPDNDDHTLPQMKQHRNFVMMCHQEKGILMAKDICECIADKHNPMYDREVAKERAFALLTEEMVCPPDLLKRCLEEGWLPEAAIPGTGERELVQENADFIARHALGYYYTGD